MKFIPALHRATHAVALHLDDPTALGVTQGEAHILAQLSVAGDSTVAALHTAFGHKRSTLTAILDRLEARRFVVRTISRDDRRSFVIRLTAKGRRAARRSRARFTAIERHALRQLSAAERNALKKGLEAFAR